MPTTKLRTHCDACQDDLAAFIDYETDVGTSLALQCYPCVRRHLWRCPFCIATYRLTRRLLQAEQRGLLPAPPARRCTYGALVMPRALRLTRTFLNYALPPRTRRMGVARGDSDDVLLVDQALDAGRHVSLCVREQTDGQWCVTVTVLPPLKGWLLLTLGEQIMRTRFNPAGSAVVEHMPAATFAATDGPDLVIGIDVDHP